MYVYCAIRTYVCIVQYLVSMCTKLTHAQLQAGYKRTMSLLRFCTAQKRSPEEDLSEESTIKMTMMSHLKKIVPKRKVLKVRQK